jgi:hypothetical protein
LARLTTVTCAALASGSSTCATPSPPVGTVLVFPP